MYFDEKLKDLRIKNELSLHELAEKLHIPEPILDYLETGFRDPSADELKRITDFFQVTAEDLADDQPTVNALSILFGQDGDKDIDLPGALTLAAGLSLVAETTGTKNETIKALFQQYERPFYLYDECVMAEQAELLLQNFPDCEFLYSIKTNPYSKIVEFIAQKGLGADAASANEVLLAHTANISREKIFYSAPGKSRKDLEATIDKCTIIADSYHELSLLNILAKEKGLLLETGLRINPSFGMEGVAVSSKFGVDEETLLEHKDFFASLQNIKLVGLHVHVRSQVLYADKLSKYYENILQLALFAQQELSFALKFINFGGGLGIVYSEKKDTPLDIAGLGEKFRQLLKDFRQEIPVRFLIETGRFLVGQMGSYVTSVVDVKESRGKKYLIAQNTLNGFLRPSIAAFADFLRPGHEELPAMEPIFTGKDAITFQILQTHPAKECETVDIVGHLCTAADVMAKNITLPKAEVGDILVVSRAGSYAATLSPTLFSGHLPPLEFYLAGDGRILL